MNHQSLSPDLPIESAKDDRLNRSRFAEGLATAIKNWAQPSSLVIAVYGDWGSGKSSLKNMVLESLRSEHQPIPVIEFNPWQISSQESLSRAFFDELGTVLGRPTSGETPEAAEKRAAKWKSYSAYFSVGTSLTKSLKVILPLMGVPLVGEVLDRLAEGLEKSGALTKEAAEGVQAGGKASGRSLNELKRDVAQELRDLPQPILVVVDDVDRLVQDEIRLLFQLIKANGDFPNLVYLVLAQRESVVKALEQIAPGRADAFLEKIVQVGFNVPRIQQRQLEQIFFSGLDQMLGDDVVAKRFDKSRWVELYRDGLRHFFSNLRDVNRYLSSLGFHVGVFRSETSFEVNLVDLIALEALRVFIPSLYSLLPDAKYILTDEPRFMRKESQKQDAAVLGSILGSVPDAERSVAEHILKALFPPAAAVLGGAHFSGGGDNWFLQLRVASHEVFDRYFHFGTPPGDLSQGELEEILQVSGDRAALVAMFKDLESRSLLEVALDRLDSYREEVPIEHAEPFITALFDLEVDSQDELLAAHFSPQTHINRIVYGYLRREPVQGQRKKILLGAISQSTSVATAAHSATWLQPRDSNTERADQSEPLLTDLEDIKEVHAAVAAKIRKAAESGQLVQESELAFLVGIWNSWGPAGEAKKWVLEELLESQLGTLRFLNITRSTARSYGGSIPKDHHYYKISEVEHFVSADELAAKIEALDPSAMNEEDRENIARFRRAIDRRDQGRPEMSFIMPMTMTDRCASQQGPAEASSCLNKNRNSYCR
jgi:predicted KAP-like P-loop ATPase